MKDSKKFFIENMKRAAKLQTSLQTKNINEVQRRDLLVRRNQYLNTSIIVANEELGYQIPTLRYRQMNAGKQINVLLQLWKEVKKEETAHAV